MHLHSRSAVFIERGNVVPLGIQLGCNGCVNARGPSRQCGFHAGLPLNCVFGRVVLPNAARAAAAGYDPATGLCRSVKPEFFTYLMRIQNLVR